MRKLISDSSYREYLGLKWKLRNTPRFSPCRVKLGQWDIFLPDGLSFLHSYKDIFVDRIYSFRGKDRPYILDLGANIGLSVLFFKSLYPEAEITALEADPGIFRYLEKNVHGNGFTDVNLVNKAAWCENTILSFNSEGADGGRVDPEAGAGLVQVEAVAVSELLRQRHTDFLKIDIEGAEECVLRSCRDCLGDVDFLFVEYHSRAGEKQGLHEIMGIMADAGFRVHVQSALCSPSPFAELDINNGYDMQLNIFGWR